MNAQEYGMQYLCYFFIILLILPFESKVHG